MYCTISGFSYLSEPKKVSFVLGETLIQKKYAKINRVMENSLNKKPMGHIAHLRKQFKSINTYHYIITLIKRRKKNIVNFMRIYFFFI